jgi:Na+/glutamate symporter
MFVQLSMACSMGFPDSVIALVTGNITFAGG